MKLNFVCVFTINVNIDFKAQTFDFLSESNCLVTLPIDIWDRTSLSGSLFDAFNFLTTLTRTIVTTTSPTPSKIIEYHSTSSQ